VIVCSKGEYVDRVFVDHDRTPEMDQYVRELASKVESDVIAAIATPDAPVTTVNYETTTSTTVSDPV
jgi:hypothetical protein